MIKRFLAALAAATLSTPALAAPFVDRSGDIISDVTSRTHPELVGKLYDVAQWASEPECWDDAQQECMQDVYALYDGQVYYFVTDLVGPKVSHIMLVRTAPLNSSTHFDGYLASGIYHINRKCEIQIRVQNAFTGEYIIQENTPLAEGYSCPLP